MNPHNLPRPASVGERFYRTEWMGTPPDIAACQRLHSVMTTMPWGGNYNTPPEYQRRAWSAWIVGSAVTRPKVGQDVRLLVVRDCFQVSLKVGDIGEVIKDDGGLLTVQWRTGHMWIDAADVTTDLVARPCCAGCGNEIDPDCCWCGDAMADHRGMSHNHGPVPMGCGCYRTPREMVLGDLLPVQWCWGFSPQSTMYPWIL